MTLVQLFDEPELRRVIRSELEQVIARRRPDGFMNVKSAAAYLDCTEDALRARIKRGDIPVFRRHGRLYFERAELDAYVRGGTRP